MQNTADGRHRTLRSVNPAVHLRKVDRTLSYLDFALPTAFASRTDIFACWSSHLIREVVFVDVLRVRKVIGRPQTRCGGDYVGDLRFECGEDRVWGEKVPSRHF